jgi:N-acetylmuramoyl-L-alanine amidase
MAYKIFIDAGHGGSDPGATKGSRLEKTDNLNISLKIASRLKDHGFEVKETRTDDKEVSLNQRTNEANTYNADLFISVHRNAASTPEANGMEVFVYPGTSSKTKGYASAVYNEIINVYAQSKRGVKESDLHVLRETNMHAILIEFGFITNDTDNKGFDDNLGAYAEAVVKAVCKEFGVEYKGEQNSAKPETPANNDDLYRVQVGAFSNKENAEKLLQKLKDEEGFTDAFIKKG